MSKVYLTKRDYEVIATGEEDAIKRHFNQVRGELEDLKSSVRQAVRNLEPAERLCQLRAALNDTEKKDI